MFKNVLFLITFLTSPIVNTLLPVLSSLFFFLLLSHFSSSTILQSHFPVFNWSLTIIGSVLGLGEERMWAF